jgi:hypothetical protein
MTRMLLSLTLAVTATLAYSSGPPDGKTGRPGEGICSDCHSGAGSGDSTTLTGFPTGSYLPDSLHRLTLAVRYGAQRRWGFEVTSATQANASAGQFIVLDSVHTQYSTAGGFQYVKHTSAGTYPGGTSASWSVGWRAPAAGTGPVTFYWCCNAANNDGSTSGDFALPSSLTVAEGSAIAQEKPARRFQWRYTNPARLRAVIEFQGDPEARVRIYSSQGKLVRVVAPENREAPLRLVWDGRDEHGTTVPEGSYFLRLGEEVGSVLRLELIR